MAVSLICLLLPLSLGDAWGCSGRTIGLFVAAVAFGAGWVVTPTSAPSAGHYRPRFTKVDGPGRSQNWC
jgi:hypothetical protein